MIKRTGFAIIYILLFHFLPQNSIGQSSYTGEGRVIDFDTKEPVKNASVTISRTKTGTVTNDSGYFSITSRVPRFTIVISSVSYVHHSKELDLVADSNPFIVELKKKANEQLDEVVVNASVEGNKVNKTEMNTLKLNPELIKRSPLLFGEADIIKALILQPGVTTTGEGAGGFNVRGGNADQNLVLIDEAPLFNTSHLLGFYTSVSPDAVQDVTLYKGGMPAEYGGRLASLLNMKMKNGNTPGMQYSGGISPMSGRFFANGPLVKDKLSFTGGFRVAYPDIILRQLNGKFGDSRAFFYDGILKSEYALNTDNKISVTAYRSFDTFRFDSLTTYDWESNLVSFNYVSSISKKLSFKFNANYSQFISTINSHEKNYEFKLTSSISQQQLKTVFTYKLNDKNKLDLGAAYNLYQISPGRQDPSSSNSNIISAYVEEEKGREISAFISNETELTEKISFQAGVRFASYDYLGPKKTYQYEPGVPLAKETITDTIAFGNNEKIQNYPGVEPRISLKIGLNDNLSFKLSYNRGQQFLHLISNTTSISPVDFWKLSDNYIDRQIGDQYAAGVYRNFNNSRFETFVEVYYKTTKNIVQYKDGATLLLNPYIESALLNGRGRAYGIEFSLNKKTGKLTGQVNYTFSRSEVQVLTDFPAEMVNNGSYYPSDIDRPHNLAIVTRLKLGRGWSFNSNFIFMSGRAATYPDGNYSYNGTLVNNYSKRNLDRLPNYHRLDAGFSYVSKRFAEQKKYSVWNISFYNIYMRDNAYSIFFKRDQDDVFFARNHDSLIAYQLSVIGGLIPSITWNFYF